jgi:Tfp pilus assembly protein FimV
MTSWCPWMMTVGWMTDQEIVEFKLALAKAWLDNGQESMARDIIRTIVEKAEGQNDSL